MKKIFISDAKTASAGCRKISFASEFTTNEILRKRVRRAVKSVAVPQDLEARLWDLIKDGKTVNLS